MNKDTFSTSHHSHVDDNSHIHQHSHVDGNPHSPETENSHIHVHSHDHSHGHSHDPATTKAIVNRLAKAAGHLLSVKSMVENQRDCSDVLIQLAAVKSAINNTGKEILKEHISHCIVDAIETGDTEAIEKLNKAIDSFMK